MAGWCWEASALVPLTACTDCHRPANGGLKTRHISESRGGKYWEGALGDHREIRDCSVGPAGQNPAELSADPPDHSSRSCDGLLPARGGERGLTCQSAWEGAVTRDGRAEICPTDQRERGSSTGQSRLGRTWRHQSWQSRVGWTNWTTTARRRTTTASRRTAEWGSCWAGQGRSGGTGWSSPAPASSCPGCALPTPSSRPPSWRTTSGPSSGRGTSSWISSVGPMPLSCKFFPSKSMIFYASKWRRAFFFRVIFLWTLKGFKKSRNSKNSAKISNLSEEGRW